VKAQELVIATLYAFTTHVSRRIRHCSEPGPRVRLSVPVIIFSFTISAAQATRARLTIVRSAGHPARLPHFLTGLLFSVRLLLARSTSLRPQLDGGSSISSRIIRARRLPNCQQPACLKGTRTRICSRTTNRKYRLGLCTCHWLTAVCGSWIWTRGGAGEGCPRGTAPTGHSLFSTQILGRGPSTPSSKREPSSG